MNIVNNYRLQKEKSIFVDGTTETVNFYLGAQLEYIAIIENNKVKELFKKNFSGEGKKIYKIPSFVNAAINYFNNNTFDIINNYIKLQGVKEIEK